MAAHDNTRTTNNIHCNTMYDNSITLITNTIHIALLYNTTQVKTNTMQYNAIPHTYNTIPSITMPGNTKQYNVRTINATQ